jgi:hypothetical protein
VVTVLEHEVDVVGALFGGPKQPTRSFSTFV